VHAHEARKTKGTRAAPPLPAAHPPLNAPLGWYTLLTKRTFGGLLGYSSPNSKISEKVPPSQGVSSGPKITACQTMMLLSSGAALIPGAGSFVTRLKSRTRRWRAEVDITKKNLLNVLWPKVAEREARGWERREHENSCWATTSSLCQLGIVPPLTEGSRNLLLRDKRCFDHGGLRICP
jgi:hypothetical protein